MNLFLCSTFCFQPKFNDQEYAKYSLQIKHEIEHYTHKIEKSCDSLINTDLKLVTFLNEVLDVLASSQTVRSSLIQFRDELVRFKDSENLGERRIRIVDLMIEIVMLCYSATFYCTTASAYDKRLEKIKVEFDYFKNLIKEDVSAFDPTDKFFLSVLYKLPKLMRIKRGYQKKT